eukprot:CAMPEP_0171293242 /NCGR_PEP_ID=MMETSP0816-20121228/1425_1 /TAXON_ID=420281 /ORGANISM="Proboscia inermis, Strain CCAP1064/1" /LENGTH=316 /DNA_ID=CAMNT_0011763869 /DNA_START=28 /DNA_END=978 /DNA_ORIENTATION=-
MKYLFVGAFVFLVAIPVNLVDAFLGTKRHRVFLKPLQATTTDAIASMGASQTSIVDSISAAIPDLESKPSLLWTSEYIGKNLATLDARDAMGNANVAWLSSVNVADTMSSLTIFNGPLTDVPHLLSRCMVNADNTMTFALDFRPRAYGAYEMVQDDGSYPGPETLGRDAFTYSGNRKDYDTKFVTEEVAAFMESTVSSFEGASACGVPTELELLTQGPLSINVNMPLTDGNVAAINAAREKAADYWLTWARDVDGPNYHRPGAPINAQYVYDSKYRQNAYSALLPVYAAAFGDVDGPKLTAAESGPLDEGYVGGGS